MTVIDVAGHPTGGAARWRLAAETFVSSNPEADVRLVGASERVEPSWLIRREAVGWRRRRVAANNVSYVGGSGCRVVLLRNALHFLSPGEEEGLPGIPAGMRRQIPIVRAAARRADMIVVPCSAMADRVINALPSLRSRVQVRMHPLAPKVRGSRGARRTVLYPALVSPHKDVVGTLRRLLSAADALEDPVEIIVTATARDLRDSVADRRVLAVGPQSLDGMERLWSSAWAAFAPFSVESFGYPMAEGRAFGVPVVAPATEQNREIGGGALFGFRDHDPASLAQALHLALKNTVPPDPRPFDPDSYFRWLVDCD